MDFDIEIYKNINKYYILYQGDKNLIIQNILIFYRPNNRLCLKYISHVENFFFYTSELKKTIQNVKEIPILRKINDENHI